MPSGSAIRNARQKQAFRLVLLTVCESRPVVFLQHRSSPLLIPGTAPEQGKIGKSLQKSSNLYNPAGRNCLAQELIFFI
jgi:hypothetical protein